MHSNLKHKNMKTVTKDLTTSKTKQTKWWKLWNKGSKTEVEIHTTEVETRITKIIDKLLESDDLSIMLNPSKQYQVFLTNANNVVMLDVMNNVIKTNLNSYSFTRISPSTSADLSDKIHEKMNNNILEMERDLRVHEISELDRVLSNF